MDYAISITDPAKLIALQRAIADKAPNATVEGFIQSIVDRHVDGFALHYLVARLTKLDFLNRLTAEERIGIRAAAAQSPAIADYMAMLDAAQDVDLTDARTIGGVQALEAAGLIGEGRAAEILAL